MDLPAALAENARLRSEVELLRSLLAAASLGQTPPEPAPAPAATDGAGNAARRKGERPSAGAAEDEDGPALPPEILLLIGKLLAPGTRNLVRFMLACRSNYELLLSHHRTVFSEEFLNPLVAVERRLRILERSGDLDRVEELVFKEEAEWPTRCGTAVELAKRCPILSRFSVALATPDDLRLLCGAELRNLSVLELAVLCRIPEFNTSWRLHLPCLDTLVLRGIVRNEFLGMFGDDSCPRLSRIELRAHVEMANAMELHHRALSPRLIRKIKAVDVEDWSDFQEMLATGHFEPESVRQNWAADFVPETSWIALGRLASLVDLEVDQLPVPFLLHSLPPNLRRLEIDALLACGCLNRDDADGCVARLQRIPRLIIARMKDLPLNDEDYEDYRGLAPDFDDAEREERMEAERNVFRVLKRDGFLSAGVR